MNADDIEKCNAEFFSDPKPSSSPIMRTCLRCAEITYVIKHFGDKCLTCDRRMKAKENLPPLCNRCHDLLEEYGRWLQTLESGEDEDSQTFESGEDRDSKTFWQSREYIHLSESGFSANCEMCKTLKLEGKPYRKPVTTRERLRIQFAPRGINILGTPYSITHSEGSLLTYSPLVSWPRIRSWVADCDGQQRHPATELQFQMLLSLDPWESEGSATNAPNFCLFSR